MIRRLYVSQLRIENVELRILVERKDKIYLNRFLPTVLIIE